jgi:hypothetical protein
MLKDADCQHYYWYNREPFNKWSNEDDYRRTSKQETLKGGFVFSAIEVRQDRSKPGHCHIVIDDGEHDRYYTGVPWESIEIFSTDPTTAKDG